MKFPIEFMLIIILSTCVCINCKRMFFSGFSNIEMHQKNIINVPSFTKQQCPDGWIFQESRCQEIINF